MPERIMVFVPMYNCERQIGRVLKQFDIPTRQWFEEIVVVDNRSADRSVAAATAELRALHGLRRTLLQNEENYGLGGSHKVAFNYALDHGFDYCVVLHGDDQGNIQELLPLLRAGLHRRHDCLLGARFMLGSRLEGYSAFRTFGNYVYNGLFSLVCRRMLYDLGSGLNLYRTSYLADRHYRRFGNDLTFNYYAILAAVARQSVCQQRSGRSSRRENQT